MNQSSVICINGIAAWVLEKEEGYEVFCGYFQKLYEIAADTKLRDFQYRLFLSKIFPNTVLFKWGKVDSPTCDWCDDMQSIIHLLIECEAVTPIWEFVSGLLEIENISKEQIIFNCYEKRTNDVKNFIILITKQFIYQQKCLQKKPSTNSLLREIYFH